MDTTSPQAKPFSAITIVGLIVLVVAVVCAGIVAKRYLADQQPEVTVIASKACEPEKRNCAINIEGENIKLDFDTSAQGVKSGHQMTAVISSSLASKPTQISLQGRDMYMGENHFSLSPISADTFANELQFPVCTTGRMVWQATIKYEDGKAVVFEFEAE